MAEERVLRFSHKRRYQEAPECPCGQPNDKLNPQFAPFENTDGKCGYCHRCDKIFMPEDKPGEIITYVPPPKLKQKFVEKEPAFNFIFIDTVIYPEVKELSGLNGQYYLTFYFRNIEGKITSAKKMLYNMEPGKMKRVKETHTLYLFQRDSGYYPCLFYERDLFLYPEAKVILIESEKTACILRAKFKANLHEFIYLATGGANGLSEEKMTVLKGREVYVCYDCDQGEEDGSKPKGREAAQTAVRRLSAICQVKNFDIDPDKKDGTDLADLPDIDFSYITRIPEQSNTRIDKRLIEEMRKMNWDGEKLTDEVISALQNEFLMSPEHIREIFFIVRDQYKSEYNIKKAPLIKKVEFFLDERYDFKRNCITKRVYYKTKEGRIYKECNYADVWRDLQHNILFFGGAKTKITMSDISNLLDSAYIEDYNPFEEYFSNLAPWDGVDNITNLANYVTCEDQKFWVTQFKKALVRMIACTIGGIPNRIIMVFVGEAQEAGKSSMIRFICPPELKKYYKEDKMKDNKDAEIALGENFIWNLEELDQLNKREVSEIKDIISRNRIKQRRAYARHEDDMLRIINFWGSTNKVDFLTDTQNTRWMCFKVMNVSYEYNNYTTKKSEIDISNIWAQAWYLYKSGFDYNLTAEEREYRDLVNKTFENVTSERELIVKYLKPGEESAGAEFMVNVDILQHITIKTGINLKLASENIGRAMRQLGFKQASKKLNGKTCRGYFVMKRDPGVKEEEVMPEQPKLFSEESFNPDELPF